ncbi:MAG TPA: class I SAM-dependent methyltransferase [Rhodospirillales bacterium]|nr:class I SAM-dependent methyltransferase [Rhodospirillales bacterium]
MKALRRRRFRRRYGTRALRRREDAASVRAGYPELADLFAGAEPSMRAVLDAIDSHAADLLAIAAAAAAQPAPRFGQDWFPRLDALAAYALVRKHRPARLVEIGCGHSTRWFARAVADGGLATRVTAIDPRPRATVAGLPVTLLRTTVQRAGADPFADLAAGDMLSLDGSHILMPGSDVDVVLNRVVPRLPAGVLLHLHDIFLPAPYPVAWTWRGYNEQQAVATMLAGGGWRIRWSSRWAATGLTERLATSIAAGLPLPPGAHEASLWLEKQ